MTSKFSLKNVFNISKYPQQQMQLIRKRLKVEFWVDDQLRLLYDIKVDLNHLIFIIH